MKNKLNPLNVSFILKKVTFLLAALDTGLDMVEVLQLMLHSVLSGPVGADTVLVVMKGECDLGLSNCRSHTLTHNA